jgi:6-phosphogluconolactonase
VIPPENLHPFLFDDNKLDFGLDQYENEIKNFGGIFDIVLLSSGEDGHIGSLFPNHPSISSESDYCILVDNSPKPPKRRMSISKKFLLKSSIGVLLFVGNMKREAYLKFLKDNVDISDCPAKLVAQLPESYALTNIKIDED